MCAAVGEATTATTCPGGAGPPPGASNRPMKSAIASKS